MAPATTARIRNAKRGRRGLTSCTLTFTKNLPCFFLEEGKSALPHTFSFTEKKTRFTKGRFRPLRRTPHRFTTQLPFARPVCVICKDENRPLVKRAVFVARLKVCGWGPFPLFQSLCVKFTFLTRCRMKRPCSSRRSGLSKTFHNHKEQCLENEFPKCPPSHKPELFCSLPSEGALAGGNAGIFQKACQLPDILFPVFFDCEPPLAPTKRKDFHLQSIQNHD